MHRPFRFLIDTNIFMSLAQAKYMTKKEFLETKDKKNIKKKHDEIYDRIMWLRIYDSLVWIQKMLDERKIELVVPVHAIAEMTQMKPSKHDDKYVMTEEEIAEINRKDALRRLARKYGKNCPSVKYVAFASKDDLEQYLKRVRDMSRSYCEEKPSGMGVNKARRNISMPFLIKPNNRVSNDARIFAEATILGLDFLTFDNHFVGMRPFDKAEKLCQINKALYKSHVRPYQFLYAVETLRMAERQGIEFHKLFRPGKGHIPIARNAKILDNGDYCQAIDYAHTNSVKNMERAERRFIAMQALLFEKYLTEPIDLNALEPYEQNK